MMDNTMWENEVTVVKGVRALDPTVVEFLSVLPVGVAVLDAAGYVSFCNAISEDLLGIPLKHEKWIDVIHRAFAPRVDDGHEISLKDGRRVHVMTCSLPGTPGQLIVLQDLTATRELQEKMSENQQLFAMGKMMASLAHQIRTPLTAAMLYATNLQEALGGEARQQHKLDRLCDSLQNIEKQISDMLLFARGDNYVCAEIDLEGFLVLLRRSLEKVLYQNIDAFHIEANVSKHMKFWGSETTLLGALQNLVINAFQACRTQACVVLRVSESENSLIFTVTDNGCGISEAHQDKIFDSFFTTKQQGTGLGLAVVRNIVRFHGGQVFVRSTEGIGSAVGFSIPKEQA